MTSKKNFLFPSLLKGIFLNAFLFLTFLGFNQTTLITGVVKDALTFEPVPFVNISFKGTLTGTQSDPDGKFSLSTQQPVDSIFASFIGYNPVTLKINRGKSQTMEIMLQINKVQLAEAVVKPGKNPALVLLEKVIESKSANDKEKLGAYQYEVYNKVEFDLDDIREKFVNRRIMRPFRFVFDAYSDSSVTNRKKFLPVFLSESVSDFYFRKNPQTQKEIIRANKISGMENASFTQFMGDMYAKTNIYDNQIIIFKKSFTSPISNSGPLFYKYYLEDSAFMQGKWCYKIRFVPRRKQEYTFLGEMWIHDSTFAVRKVSARIPQDININFVEDLAVVQEFEQVEGQWMLSKDMLVVDLKSAEAQMSFIGRKTTSYQKFILEQPRSMDFFLSGGNIIVQDSSLYRSREYWDTIRHEKLEEREARIYEMVDTIKSLPAFKSWVNLLTTLVTGYRMFKFVELGPYYTFVSFNRVEGPRFRLGGRTGNSFSTDMVISGYLAYGTRDQKFKYAAGGQYYFSKKPRNSIGIFYKSDIEQLGQSENAFQDDNILSSVSRRGPATKLTKIEETNIFYEYEWYPGFSSKISFFHRFYDPIKPLDYSYYTDFPFNRTAVKNSLNTSEVSFFSRFAYREKFVAGKIERVSLGTKYPVFQFRYTYGLKGILGSDLEYHKAMFKISHFFHTGMFGWTEYAVETGQVWGTLPYPLLQVHQGNETFSYDPLSFNMMNFFEFVSDRYASLFLTHHFDGFFLNHIPLLRKLKWREVATAKACIGELSGPNKRIYLAKTFFSSPTKPYLEAGLGVENILKVFRVDVLWRLAYNDKNYIRWYESLNTSRIAVFGIRGSFQFLF